MSKQKLPQETGVMAEDTVILKHEREFESFAETEYLVRETKPIQKRKPGFFRRIYGRRCIPLKIFATICGLLIFCVLVALVGHFARDLRVLIEEKKTADGQGIDADLFGRFNLFEQYSAAAYCASNTNSSNSKLVCADGKCPLVEAADTVTQVEFAHSEFTDVTGFVAVDNTNKLVVISFRGTVSIENKITDLNFTHTESDLCPKCLVHQGFWFSWTEARDETLSALTTVAKQNPTYKIVVTGHSLGAAIATFCAAEVRKLGYPATLYTYGSPRIGNSVTIDWILAQSNDNFRVTHYNDIVPHLPPLSVPGADLKRDIYSGYDYVHISPEYYISTPTNETVALGDISTYLGLVTYKGNTGQAIPSVAAHKWYFNNIGLCAHVS